MAITDKNTIYSWFQTDDFPTEAQFRATWDSFWHKSESIPMSQITGLNQLFQQTATVAQLNNKANIDGSNIDVSAYQEKLNITNLIATAKEEVKNELLNGAPEAFDTLKEISDWISDDETAEGAILQAIQTEATARTEADNQKLDKGTYTGTAQDLYDRFESKITAGFNNIPKVGNGASGKVLESSNISEINGKIGISIAGEPSEQLEIGGNIKAVDFKGKSVKFDLQASITPTPNTLVPKTDGTRPIWYNNDSVGNALAFKSDIDNIQIGGIIEITYDELVNLKNTSTLVKGQNYLLTDYMTTYIQPVTSVNKSSGVIEPLIITATDVNKLHNQCKSTLYPQDIVYYEITGYIGNGYGTEGFTKGKIYRRIDTLRNNDIGTDWRHVKYDRNGVDKLLFENYNDCYNNVIKTYNLFNSVVGSSFNSNTIGISFYSNTIGNNFNSNKIENGFNSNTIEDGFSSNTIGDGFYSNTIENGFNSNKIENGFNSNTIEDGFSSNTIGNSFYSNTIGNSFYSNTIENGFNSNKIENGFSSNTIGNSFYSNTIENGFNSNTIEDGFSSNTIGNSFYSNTIGNGFYNNGTTSTPFASQNTEFRNNISNLTSSTEIQNANIDVVVFKSPNGTKKQRYYDDSNNLVINNL